MRRFIALGLVALVVAGAYLFGQMQGLRGDSADVLSDANASESENAGGWSPTGVYPDHEVYFPGTEALGPDEIRVIACGSGMPMPRTKQAAACFLVELGNGEKLIVDLGTGSFTTLYALGMPLDYMTKIFITHQHADHMGDLPTMWIYGMQNGRSLPLEIWGPGGGGMPDNWGMKHATDGILNFYNWMLETSKGALDTRSLAMNVHEYDWSKVNNVIYDEDGAVVRTIPADPPRRFGQPYSRMEGHEDRVLG